MKKNKRNLKFLSSIMLGILAITGGVLSMPSFNNIYDKPSQLSFFENIKILEKSPDRFLQPSNLGLKDNFKEFENKTLKTNNTSNENEFYIMSSGGFDRSSKEKDKE
jgi:hypothetical protein